jgi:hypothetical protein
MFHLLTPETDFTVFMQTIEELIDDLISEVENGDPYQTFT